jgi:Domain of unknown function (DUF1707)
VLASDADRETVAGQLSTAYAEGRLTAGEHSERVRAAYGARTLGGLGALTADLPAPPAAAADREAAVIPGKIDRCLLCALLILCPPAGIAWLLAARRRSRPAVEPPSAGAVASAGSAWPAPAGPETTRFRGGGPMMAGAVCRHVRPPAAAMVLIIGGADAADR